MLWGVNHGHRFHLLKWISIYFPICLSQNPRCLCMCDYFLSLFFIFHVVSPWAARVYVAFMEDYHWAGTQYSFLNSHRTALFASPLPTAPCRQLNVARHFFLMGFLQWKTRPSFRWWSWWRWCVVQGQSGQKSVARSFKTSVCLMNYSFFVIMNNLKVA